MSNEWVLGIFMHHSVPPVGPSHRKGLLPFSFYALTHSPLGGALHNQPQQLGQLLLPASFFPFIFTSTKGICTRFLKNLGLLL